MRPRHVKKRCSGGAISTGGAYKRGGAVGGSVAAAAEHSVGGKQATRRVDRAMRGHSGMMSRPR